jgi:small conductance mechanosensitive channel
LQRQVKERFDAEGISIPFPQRDVHLYTTMASGAATAGALAELPDETTEGKGIALNSPGHDD